MLLRAAACAPTRPVCVHGSIQTAEFRRKAKFNNITTKEASHAPRLQTEKSFFILNLESVQLCPSAVLPHAISAQNCADFRGKEFVDPWSRGGESLPAVQSRAKVWERRSSRRLGPARATGAPEIVFGARGMLHEPSVAQMRRERAGAVDGGRRGSVACPGRLRKGHPRRLPITVVLVNAAASTLATVLMTCLCVCPRAAQSSALCS